MKEKDDKADSLRCDKAVGLIQILTRKPSCRWQTRATLCNVIVAPSGGTPNNINEIYTSM